MKRQHLIASAVALALVAAAMLAITLSIGNVDDAEAGGSANRVPDLHLGGDAMYCGEASGCWQTNSNGEVLWSVSAETLNEGWNVACSNGNPQTIYAGEGTFGPSYMSLNCYTGLPRHLVVCGFDEHGKQNCVRIYTNGFWMADPTANIPATDTPQSIDTQVPATDTQVAPTSTDTQVPLTATNTQVPPTATDTLVPTDTATNTPTATNTATNTPTLTPTDTPIIILVQ